jgi:hypothetical protein
MNKTVLKDHQDLLRFMQEVLVKTPFFPSCFLSGHSTRRLFTTGTIGLVWQRLGHPKTRTYPKT